MVAGVDFTVVQDGKRGGNAMADGKRHEPVMQIDNSVVSGANAIIARLRAEGKDLDRHLSARDQAEAQAFISMLQGTLQTAMECEWYLNDNNWFEVVRPLYTTGAFPGNWILPMQVHRSIKARLGYYDAERKAKLFASADACYSALAARLGDGTGYFFGERPSTLDVAAFAHLAVHLYSPMVDARLLTSLRKHPSLLNFVSRFRNKHVGTKVISSKVDVPEVEQAATTAAAEQGSKEPPKESLSPEDKARRRRAKDFLAFGAIVTLAWCLFTNVIDVDAAEVPEGVEA